MPSMNEEAIFEDLFSVIVDVEAKKRNG